MKKLIPLNIIFILLFNLTCYSQIYKIVNKSTVIDTLPYTEDYNSTLFYKAKDSTLYQFHIINTKNDTYNLVISNISLKNYQVCDRDTISGIPFTFNIQDIDFNKENIFICGLESFITYKKKHLNNSIYFYPKGLEYNKDTIPFRYCNIINDSLVLLYVIYNYHPNDHAPGLYMKILNLNTKEVTFRKYMHFQGIGFSHLNQNWLTVINDKIYVITPLSEQLFVFDLQLNLLKKVNLSLFNQADKLANFSYEKSVDSEIENECSRINKIKLTIPTDSLSFYNSKMQSYVYSKDYILKNIKKIKENYSFIERIFNIDDSILAISISKPEYYDKYRDLVLMDPKDYKVLKIIKKWNCVPFDTLKKPEDFFTVNITKGKVYFPYIHKGYIYDATVYPFQLYKNGTMEDVTKDMYKFILKNGYQWSIIKYRLLR